MFVKLLLLSHCLVLCASLATRSLGDMYQIEMLFTFNGFCDPSGRAPAARVLLNIYDQPVDKHWYWHAEVTVCRLSLSVPTCISEKPEPAPGFVEPAEAIAWESECDCRNEEFWLATCQTGKLARETPRGKFKCAFQAQDLGWRFLEAPNAPQRSIS
ncbi:uncharacterized protein L969DRAFT_50091 [Mixia osmundae IAM 14324]|uniref:Uncharacterized protein n=1 Tax=Mixia osmundae (strain CBS 9802 / IAM 14324 / JCM 22182 / KY 12970) TaxID=764103 RepID=G7E202_MIXOS|nr:uncharacterized protein L969DRAFT_50091 [Mixia osmundae IAM 14324]KEI38702.1 hypothetical protein L969DRAFT_50091 [Mixia osmundae IAM 14324]GAA96839.1 hypothetical protein E5Q_03512 [Mixia osmundae IAM 14324]